MSFPFHSGAELPAVWAGVECTVNRVQDRYVDQCAKNGHATRISDLEKFAALGISRIRYPFIWEKMSPKSSGRINWTWADERVQELQRLNLVPIAGFVHHGSGPSYTSLMDPEFPLKLAEFAGSFADRYPWITDYTPVNEPLTTARFSGLYGVWYPHGKDDRTFLRTLFNEMKAVVLSMQAIRHIVPRARLIQTEDLGRAGSTPLLSYQAEFENHRRWLSLDLLTGKVIPGHPLYIYLVRNGVTEDELDWLAENGTPPDVIGINHYPLSNRFLDDRLEHYPDHLHGGNGFHAYADVGAVDTGATLPPSPKSVMREVWDRYQLPLAVTEAHISGPREAQMQWLSEIWESACELRRDGVDLVAVTAWSLLGSFDWNSLCTNCANFYEPGVFDVRGGEVRPTALATMLTSLAREGEFRHPVLEQRGWWHHPERVLFARELACENMFLKRMPSRPIVLTGATGTLGQAFARICEKRGISYRLLGRKEMDIADPASVRQAMDALKPWAVINTAGYVRVDDAEDDQERCFRENAHGPQVLARECALRAIRLVNFSTDLVFDGKEMQPYSESARPAPLSVYGASKEEAERLVLCEHEDSLVIRTSSFFGPWDEYNFVTHALRALVAGRRFEVVSDMTVSPTYVPDLVNATLDLLIDGDRGVVHLTNQGVVTWEEFARSAVGLARGTIVPDLNEDLFRPRPLAEMSFRAQRPSFSALCSVRAPIMTSLDEALDRYMKDLQVLIVPERKMQDAAAARARPEKVVSPQKNLRVESPDLPAHSRILKSGILKQRRPLGGNVHA